MKEGLLDALEHYSINRYPSYDAWYFNENLEGGDMSIEEKSSLSVEAFNRLMLNREKVDINYLFLDKGYRVEILNRLMKSKVRKVKYDMWL